MTEKQAIIEILEQLDVETICDDELTVKVELEEKTVMFIFDTEGRLEKACSLTKLNEEV